MGGGLSVDDAVAGACSAAAGVVGDGAGFDCGAVVGGDVAVEPVAPRSSTPSSSVTAASGVCCCCISSRVSVSAPVRPLDSRNCSFRARGASRMLSSSRNRDACSIRAVRDGGEFRSGCAWGGVFGGSGSGCCCEGIFLVGFGPLESLIVWMVLMVVQYCK